MAAESKLTLHTMLGNYPNVAPLKSGEVHSDLVDFDFVEVKVANNLFKPVVREAKYDLAELAIVTYLQARAYDKPYVLMPAVVVSRGQHHTIAYNRRARTLKPSDLNGKRVGVRAFTVTTGTWVRGILASDYGVDLNKVEWITFEDPHVAEFHDPTMSNARRPARTCRRCCSTANSMPPLSATSCPIRGSSILSRTPMRPRGNGPSVTAAYRSIICWWCGPICRDRGPTWCGTCSGNSTTVSAPPACPMGAFSILIVSALKPAAPTLEIIIDFCRQQKLIPRPVSVDELFDDTTRALGAG